MMSWVRSVVVVTPHAIWARVMRSVRNENGTGSSSPACFSRLAQSIEGPARRAGVPVLRRPICRPRAAKRSASLTAGGGAEAAGRDPGLAHVDEPAQECAGGDDDGAGG